MILVLLLVSAASAATITITPEAIDPGDTVTVNVQNLPDGAAFSLGIRGEFDVTPGERFAFTARNLVLPFSLGSGELSAYSRGTAWTGLAAQMPDGTSASLIKYADANGQVRATQAYSISSGTYSAVTLDGQAAPTSGSVVAEVTMQGTKTGPNDGIISFAVDGVARGTTTVTVSVDGTQALSRQIVIGGGAPIPTATQGGSSGPTTGAPPIITPVPGPVPVTSTDGKASLTGTDIEGAGLLAVTVQGTVPAGWTISGKTYAVTPEGRAFDSAATLSFRLPAAETTATLARFENGAWTPVPSKVEGDRITTPVTRAGTYALLAPAAPAAPVATTTVSATTITEGPAATTPADPTATTPPAAPVAPLLPVIALAILIFGWKRRG
ncbi:MAG: hypothetical protein PHP43_00635 [Methanoculleus sp.]|nr:hypothetical protein [Methanoculleus sp.]